MIKVSAFLKTESFKKLAGYIDFDANLALFHNKNTFTFKLLSCPDKNAQLSFSCKWLAAQDNMIGQCNKTLKPNAIDTNTA